MGLGVPSPETQSVFVIEQKDLCNDLGVSRRIQPCVVPIGVAIGGSLLSCLWADLKAEDGAHDFAVEAFAKLCGRRADVALHALAFGRAYLTDPSVLQHGKCRKQHEQRSSDQSWSRRSIQRHAGQSSTN